MTDTINLNEKELEVLRACKQDIKYQTGTEFGITSEIKLPKGMTRNQLKGYLSQLQQKGWIEIDSSYDCNGQFKFKKKALCLSPLEGFEDISKFEFWL